MSGIQCVGVIGGGLMGAGIAEVHGRAGLDTLVVEVSRESAARAKVRVESSLERALERGKISHSELTSTLARISFSSDLTELASCDLVVEAASEDESIKLELFSKVGRIVESEEAVLASNTSSIPIVKLGAASGRPEQVIGVHFFNPAPVMQLVELVPALTTSATTVRRVRAFVADSLGKVPIEASDRAGFVVNSLLVPFIMSAIRMYEAGYAAAGDIDRGMTLGCGHPMGPLALADLIGLDTLRAIGVSMYEEFKEPLFSPPPLLDRMVAAGLLGTKSGRGFYPY